MEWAQAALFQSFKELLDIHQLKNLLCFIKFPSFSNAQWKELQTYKKICWLLPFVGMIDDFFEFQEKTLSSTCTKLHEKLAQKREKCLQKLMECSIKPSASYEISSSSKLFRATYR